jgi:periplasmic divalent cation tolerance protein
MHLIYCPCPDADVAEALARGLLEQRLAVCVNIIPAVTSLFVWDGQIVQETEVVMVVKTLTPQEASDSLAQNHPYDVPAIIAIPADANAAFQAWAQGV